MQGTTGFNPFSQFGLPPQVQKPKRQGPQPERANPFVNTGSTGGPGGDPLSEFKGQINSGELNLNPNKPRAGEGLGGRLNVSV